jgi:RHS repeat-associated protein
MKKLYYIFLFIGFAHFSFGQITDLRINYELAFDEMHKMLKGEIPISFKRAVFLTENAYLENQLKYEDFVQHIDDLTKLAKAVVATDGLEYNKKDRNQVLLAGSLYRVMKDFLIFENPDKSVGFKKYPYTYDTADFCGEKDWTKMFVIKLLATQTGNCHSLPILYKILADEIGAEAWLSITPNHTYIKQWNDKTGWYNTELTSGRFPYDAEIKNNSYIKHEAIVDGVYMDTLTVKENISYAITDLAQGYIKKFGYDDIETPVRWLEAALVYYPDFPNALILKSELLKKKYETAATEKGEKNFLKPKDTELKKKFEELEKSYFSVHQVGYRRMPKEMYLNWLYRVRGDTTRKPYKFESPQPFKDYNYKVLVMTASDGYNYEFYDQEDTTRIGTVVINRLTGKIVKFIKPEKDDFSDEVISRMYDPYVGRFWQVDPHSENYFSLSPYNAFANNPVLFTDPDGRDIVFYVVTTEGDRTKVNFSDLDKNYQKALSAFVKTKEGREFLGQFAKKGDKIGDYTFEADGKYSKHDFSFAQYSAEGAQEAATGDYSVKNGKVTFEVKMNLAYNDETTEQAVSAGHEAFIHIDSYDDRLISAVEKNDKKAISDIVKERRLIREDRSGGPDHDSYLNSQRSRMNSYISQLRGVLNPASVDKEIKKHDDTLKRDKKTN